MTTVADIQAGYTTTLDSTASGAKTLDELFQTNLSAQSQAFVTPQMRNAIGKGLKIAGTLGPAYSVIDKIAQGGSGPSEQDAVLGMASLAGAINPIAGAAMMAIGEIMVGAEEGLKSLFHDLGLISDVGKPVDYIGLIRKEEGIPVAPRDGYYDPQWLRFNDFARVWWPGGATATGWTPGLIRKAGKGFYAHSTDDTPATNVIKNIMGQFWMSSPNAEKPPGNSVNTAFVVSPLPKNDFEKFLIPIMERNIEYWANGNAFIDPRKLLMAAIGAWNDKHRPSPNDVTYSPDIVNGGYGEGGYGKGDFVRFLLGQLGDATGSRQKEYPQTVLMGTTLENPPPNTIVVHTPTDTLHVAVDRGTAAGQALIAQLKAKNAGVAAGKLKIQALQNAKVAKPLQNAKVAKPLKPKIPFVKIALGLAAIVGFRAILRRKH